MIWIAFLLALQVEAVGDCPTQNVVKESLSDVGIGERNETELTLRIQQASSPINGNPSPIRAVLIDRHDRVLATRELSADAACRERATEAAIFTATFLHQIRAGATPRYVEGVAAAPAQPIAEPLKPTKRFALRRGDLGAAVVPTSTPNGKSSTVGAAFQATLHFNGLPALRVGYLYAPARSITLDSGVADWNRSVGAISARFPLHHFLSWGDLTFNAGPILGRTRVQGRGFAPDRTSTGWVPGVRFALEWNAARLGNLDLELGLGTAVWLANERATVRDTALEGTLPSVDVMATVGFNFYLFENSSSGL